MLPLVTSQLTGIPNYLNFYDFNTFFNTLSEIVEGIAPRGIERVGWLWILFVEIEELYNFAHYTNSSSLTIVELINY